MKEEAFGDKAATMTLPDILKALAERLPERVRETNYNLSVRVAFPAPDPYSGNDGWIDCYERMADETWMQLPRLVDTVIEASLREECDARDWEWGIEGNATQATGTVWRQGDTPDHCHVATAPTPAHALAWAMLAALSGEGEG